MGKITDIKFMDIGLYVNLYHFIINVDEWQCVLKCNATEQMITSLVDVKRNLKEERCTINSVDMFCEVKKATRNFYLNEWA